MAYRNYATATSHIVDITGQGDFTTIGSALTAASASGFQGTIVIRPGTYTENITLIPGVNLCAFSTDDNSGTVIISGTCTFNSVGIVNLSCIQLQTNGNFFLLISGSTSSTVNLFNCNLICLNQTGISFTNSNSGSRLNIYQCIGNISTTGVSLISDSNPGITQIFGCDFTNSGASTTANTKSAGTLNVFFSLISNPITSSGTTAIVNIRQCVMDNSATNTISLTIGSTSAGSSAISQSRIASGSASVISVGAGATLNVNLIDITSTATDAITGSGTIAYSGVSPSSGSTTLINTTTQSTAGVIKGLTSSLTSGVPTAGMIGEQIRATVARASSVTATTATSTNITSINLTAGVWDISGVVSGAGMTTAVQFDGSVNTASSTLGTAGDNFVEIPFTSNTNADVTVTIPSWRQTFNATTTVYLVARGTFSVGTGNFYGRISATRVG